MIPIYCFRCLQISNSTDGVRCSHCDKDEASRTPITENFPPPVSEPGNVSPGYYVPASDASTQTTDEDFLLLEPNRDASSQTTDSDFSFLAEINGGHGYPVGSENHSSSQVFYQDSSQHKNISEENINFKSDDFQILNIDRCNSSTIGPSLESLNESIESPKKRKYPAEQLSSDEGQNVDIPDNMFKKQRTEYVQQVNEVGKLNFVDSISLLSGNSVPNSNTESYANVNSSIVLARKKNNNSISDHFLGNVGTTKSHLEHEVRNSGKARRKVSKPKVLVKRSLRCGKCGASFFKEWILQVHVANCKPDPCKCDKCGTKFRHRSECLNHQSVHTEERSFKCDHCAYAAKRKGDLKSHKEKYHKK